MSSNNKYGLEKVGRFSWPFYSYEALLPKKVKRDMFEWLYLSLIVAKNKELHLDECVYKDEVKAEVRSIIKAKFASVINEDTLDNIISTAEEEYVVKRMSPSNKILELVLSSNVPSLLETYDDLFSSNASNKTIYQDAITGDIVPWFDSDNVSGDVKKDSDILKIDPRIPNKKMHPSTSKVKRSFNLYNKLLVPGENIEEALEEYNNSAVIDEDAEIVYEPYADNDFDADNNQDDVSSDFRVLYLDNCKVRHDLEITVYYNHELNKLEITTPFNSTATKSWLNQKLKHARNSCEELEKYLSDIEKIYEITPIEIEDQNIDKFVYKQGVSDTLSKCKVLYKMVEHLPSDFNNIKRLIIQIDKYFSNKSMLYFSEIGRYLEALIDPYVDNDQKQERALITSDEYREVISLLERQLNIDLRPIKSNKVFENWQKGYASFKSDLANLIFNNQKLALCKQLYPSFVRDAFDLYDLRNNVSHYKKHYNLNYDEEQILKLEKITRIMIELYEG